MTDQSEDRFPSALKQEDQNLKVHRKPTLSSLQYHSQLASPSHNQLELKYIVKAGEFQLSAFRGHMTSSYGPKAHRCSSCLLRCSLGLSHLVFGDCLSYLALVVRLQLPSLRTNINISSCHRNATIAEALQERRLTFKRARSSTDSVFIVVK